MEKNFQNIRQIEHETEEWKKTLRFLQQENIVHKNKLAEILKLEERKENMLDIAEQYQARFLQQDEAFRLMRNDIAELEKLIRREQLNQDNHRVEFENQEKKLAGEVKSLKMIFNKLNTEFTTFLLSYAAFYC